MKESTEAKRKSTHCPILGLGQPPRQGVNAVRDIGSRAAHRGCVEYFYNVRRNYKITEDGTDELFRP
jgi:hypothetical protein